jgi:hypothetical protein
MASISSRNGGEVRLEREATSVVVGTLDTLQD